MPFDEQLVLGLARAEFMNRLHVLRLTEIVRLQIRPKEDGIMTLPAELDQQMIEQAFNFVLACFPTEFHAQIHQARRGWLELH
jgi:hypothetical protein